nr:MAG TPA: hypothetical protein [Caudoviricetes sp.]
MLNNWSRLLILRAIKIKPIYTSAITKRLTC